MILYMATISSLVDRRMLSYETALGQLGFDYDNEFNNMKNEFPSVLEGILGIIGSPFQKSDIQPVQNAPVGPPSSGRPKGQVPKKKQPSIKTNKKTKVPKQTPSQQPGPSPQAASITVAEAIQKMNDEEYDFFLNYLNVIRDTDVE
jgi:hypothetical protein